MILRHMEPVIILRYSKAVLHCLSFCPDANVDPSHESRSAVVSTWPQPHNIWPTLFIRRTWRLHSTVSFWFIEMASIQNVFDIPGCRSSRKAKRRLPATLKSFLLSEIEAVIVGSPQVYDKAQYGGWSSPFTAPSLQDTSSLPVPGSMCTRRISHACSSVQ